MTSTDPLTESADAPAPGRTRRNRGSEVVRGALLEAAFGEFAAEGFNGASGRAIAAAADTHQSQINYHFSSKEELWKAAMTCLLDELDAHVGAQTAVVDRDDPVAAMAAAIRGLVHFAAARPELNRLMIHEGAAPGPRLGWLVGERTAARHGELARLWTAAQATGAAAPIDTDVVYHSLVGAASLLYANAPEAELLGLDPADPALIARHARSLITLFLPGHTPEEI